MRRGRHGFWLGSRLLIALAVVASIALAPEAAATEAPPVWVVEAASGIPLPVEADYEPPPVVFDAASGQLVLDGMQGTWLWNGIGWTEVAIPAATPPPRRSAIASYDQATAQVVVFGGGAVPFGASTTTRYFDTWTWNGAVWTQQHPTVVPDIVRGCAGYDAGTGRLFMFGVDPTGRLGGWFWTGDEWTAAASSQLPPTPSGICSMASDPASGRLMLLMNVAGSASPQIWVRTGAGWEQAPAILPVSTAGQLVYDSDTGQLTAMLGVTPKSSPFVGFVTQQLWSGDTTSSWEQQQSAPTPLVTAAAMAYDAATRQLLYVDAALHLSLPSPMPPSPMPPSPIPPSPIPSTSTWVYARPVTSGVSPVRIFGADRESTAVAISRSAFPGASSASAVVLARADEFADALAGGPLAAAKDAPLLLTSSGALDPVTKAEIRRVLRPGGTVYLLGDTHALSDAVHSEVRALGAVPVRLAGNDRFATAVAIAEALGNPSTVFEASGIGFADALAAVPAAVFEHAAILLTDGPKQATATANYLTAHPGHHVAVGGTAAAADPDALALVGADRYATSETVALAVFPDAASSYIASGVNFPDALAGGPRAGAVGEPVLLVPAFGALPYAVRGYLATHPAQTPIQVLGSSAAIRDDIVAAVGDAMR